MFEDSEGIIYLVTNGHNVTGVNPETNEKLPGNISFPHTFKVQIHQNIKRGNQSAFQKSTIVVNLYKDKDYKDPNWLFHPEFGYKVDVICIPIGHKNDLDKQLVIVPINKHSDLEDTYPIEVSDDVFVLGFPFNISGGLNLPIWKRGTIATEPAVNIDKMPKILIDTATRKGMSGSPVIFRRSGIHGLKEDPDGDEVIGTIHGFVGIYSGRIGADDNFLSQLGIVWKKTVIDEILSGQVRGDLVFQQI